MVKKIVESERKAFKELMDEVVKINTRNEEIHTEIVRIKKGIDLLEPQRQAKQDIYDALLDDTSKNDLDKAIKQLQDAKEKLDALKVEKAECGKRINEIEKGKKQTQDRIQLGVYLDLRNELLGL